MLKKLGISAAAAVVGLALMGPATALAQRGEHHGGGEHHGAVERHGGYHRGYGYGYRGYGYRGGSGFGLYLGAPGYPYYGPNSYGYYDQFGIWHPRW